MGWRNFFSVNVWPINSQFSKNFFFQIIINTREMANNMAIRNKHQNWLIIGEKLKKFHTKKAKCCDVFFCAEICVKFFETDKISQNKIKVNKKNATRIIHQITSNNDYALISSPRKEKVYRPTFARLSRISHSINSLSLRSRKNSWKNEEVVEEWNRNLNSILYLSEKRWKTLRSEL